jgi:large subunit ribosomal protein L23
MPAAILRRLYSTRIPGETLAARTSSTPIAVRGRRLRRRGAKQPIQPGKTDALPAHTTPTEHARYRRLLAQGKFGSSEPTEKEWLDMLNDRRQRVRGIRSHKVPVTAPVEGKEGETETVWEDHQYIVGQPVYLPNVVFRMVPNQVKPGETYNPYEATFRVPQSVTKTDIRSYLLSVYGVKTTYIRTDNYISPLFRTMKGYERRAHKTYKRAVVGLVDPFYYPQLKEHMTPEELDKREKHLEEHFQQKALEVMRKTELLRMTKTEQTWKPEWKWRGTTVIKRSNILRLVAEKRAKREGLVEDQVQAWREMRAKGETIDRIV